MTWPWEDVFIGAALAQVGRSAGVQVGSGGGQVGSGGVGQSAGVQQTARGGSEVDSADGPAPTTTGTAPTLAAVHVGTSSRPGIFVEEWGIKVAPSTLMWHMRTKAPERQRVLEAWAREHTCDLRFRRMACHEYVDCSGAAWRACEPELNRWTERNCSTRLQSLLSVRTRQRMHE